MAKFTMEATIEVPEPPKQFRIMMPGRERALMIETGELTEAQVESIAREYEATLRKMAGAKPKQTPREA